MKKELEEKLFNKYPKIFADKDKPMTETAMCWGIECGDGWYWIIDNLCECIQNYIDNNSHLNIPQVVASQVKEKFGELRFYYNGGDKTIHGMVWFAEKLSIETCEICGSTQNIGQTSGWITTLCKSCVENGKLEDRWKQYEEV